MRALSASEARVIHALLVSANVVERQREIWSGVPRATYLAARKRAFSHGWLQSRYVPDPAALGFDRITFTVDQPYSERYGEVIRSARSAPGTVVLWSSPETVLSVRFGHPGEARAADAPTNASRHRLVIEVTEPQKEVPVYFDFEGAWSIWASGLSLVTYPTGLVPPRPAGRREPARRPAAALWEELLAFREPVSEGSGTPLRLSEAYLPRGLRRMVDHRLAARRIFPNLAELPALPDGSSISEIVLVHGRFRAGVERDGLLPALLREGRIRPFLLAMDEQAALLGLLAPLPSRVRSTSRSVLEVLSERLESISVVREPIATLYPLLDHRYDRLLADPTPG